MIRQSWRTRLKASVGANDVLAVVRGFLSEWSTDEIAALPRGAWPSRIASTGDVLSHSMALAELHARFEHAPAQLKLLQELLLFFTHAGVRAVQLRETASATDCPSPKRGNARRKAKPNATDRARKRAR